MQPVFPAYSATGENAGHMSFTDSSFPQSGKVYAVGQTALSFSSSQPSGNFPVVRQAPSTPFPPVIPFPATPYSGGHDIRGVSMPGQTPSTLNRDDHLLFPALFRRN